MEFHPPKCQVVHISLSKSPSKYQYRLHNHILDSVTSAKYLGITLSNNLGWGKHIDSIANRANGTLGFLRRNMKINSISIKERAYLGLIRPQLEYCASVWDPHTAAANYALERIQRRAARWVLNRHHNTSSVSAMLDRLQWKTLQRRREECRLVAMYKMVNGLAAVDINTYLTPVQRKSRHTHQYGYIQLPARSEGYRQSYFPRTVVSWNSLPESLVTSPTLAIFKNNLRQAPY